MYVRGSIHFYIISFYYSYTTFTLMKAELFPAVKIPGPLLAAKSGPGVVRGRTNFGSEKWSARTNFRVTSPPYFCRSEPYMEV